jgi:sugar/nucleoside kinase (ribokinase family)
MKKRWDVITVGDIYIDHILMGFTNWPEPGSELYAPSYKCELGGGAAITACALGLLGRSVAVLGVVGTEESNWIASVFDAHHTDSGGLQQVDGHTGTTFSISTKDDRTLFSYAGPNSLLAARLQDDAIIEWLAHARHVHFAFALPRTLALLILPSLSKAGTTVSIDVGWKPAWYDDAANRATCREVDVFLPNEKEASYLSASVREGGTLQELTAALERMGFANAVIKLGAGGAASTYGAGCRVDAPAVEVVDTTGAGDAFDAGLIDGLLDNSTVEVMLRRGCLLGSLSASSAGALQGLPRRQEVKEEYERCYKS